MPIETASAQLASTLAVIPGPGLLFGLMLGAAIVGGYVAHTVRVPRVVGYLAAGVALKLALYRALKIEAGSPAEAQLNEVGRTLGVVTNLGLGVILFSIGGVFETRHLKAIRSTVTRIALSETGLTFVLVFLGTFAAAMWVRGDTATPTVFAFALLLGLASMATAPAATLVVLREYDAKGPVTDMILSLTGLNNILCIVMFHIAFSLLVVVGVVAQAGGESQSIALRLLAITLGSGALGVLLGLTLSFAHAKLSHGDTLLILVATLMVVGAGEGWLLEHHQVSYNFLLTAILMGATFANVAIDPNRLDEPLQLMSRPILVGFFAMAGFKLHVGDLAGLHLVGASYVVCRIIGKVLGTYLGIRWSGSRGELRSSVGAALLCQAAVVIGLADFVETYWHDPWAKRFVTVALGSIVIFEVCGPLLTKWVAKQAGEVKAVTLLRRGGTESLGTLSVIALTWHALLRTVGLGHRAARGGDDPLQVRHVMRANVKCIPASANFTDVLGFIEHSRFNHFPVVDENKELVGVIHFSDIRGVIYDPLLSTLITAVDVASPATDAVPADMPLDELLRAFQDGDVGSLPVVECEGSRNVVGIVEQRDVLRTIHEWGYV